MHVFDTPEPVLLTVELGVGTVRIAAGDRPEATVRVLPQDRTDRRDLLAAAETAVDLADGELLVSVPHTGSLPRGGGAVAVEIQVPTGSGLHGDAVAADFLCTGRLGECRITTHCGHVRAEHTGLLSVNSLLGNVAAGRVAGRLEAVVECGDLDIGTAYGAARLTRGRGATRIGETAGDLTVYGDDGDLHIGRAGAAVEAWTSHGKIRVDEAARGPLTLHSTSGDLHVGIAEGGTVSLDLDSLAGTVYRALDLLPATACPPGAEAPTVQVRAHTRFGDIVVCRAER